MKTMNKEIKLLRETSKYCKKESETLSESFSILWHTETHHSLWHRLTETHSENTHAQTLKWSTHKLDARLETLSLGHYHQHTNHHHHVHHLIMIIITWWSSRGQSRKEAGRSRIVDRGCERRHYWSDANTAFIGPCTCWCYEVSPPSEPLACSGYRG